MISEFVAAIRHIDPEITDKEIAEALWLALQIRKAVGAPELDDVTPSVEPSKPLPKDKRNFPPKPPISKPSAGTSIPQSTKIGLFPDSSQDGNGSQLLRALPFRSPAATALPGSLDIARVLRPFGRRVCQRGTTVLNEEATAKRIAEEDIWIPVLDNALTRWLEVALVVDIGKSMTIWRQTIAELRRLLARHGAFRDVRLWEIDTNNEELVRLYAGLGVDVQQRQPRSELELIDISSRRLILVVTDCVSAAWHSGVAADILAKWGHYNPVTLLQVLPRRLWSRTALGMATSVSLHAANPGTANTQLNVQSTHYWDDEEALPTVSIPIVTLEPKSLAPWAQAIARAEDVWIPGFELVIHSQTAEKQEQNDYTKYEEALAIKLSAAERVQRFRANASTSAWRLAGLLAILPITLPIVRLVQQAMFNEPKQVHVAEVFLSGLLEIASANSDALDPDEVQYDFINGVREILLNSVLLNDSSRVLTEISALITNKFAHPLDFGALLANPLDKGEVVIDKENRPFALMGAKALRRFGGEYVALANWLEESNRKGEEQDDRTGMDVDVHTADSNVAEVRVFEAMEEEGEQRETNLAVKAALQGRKIPREKHWFENVEKASSVSPNLPDFPLFWFMPYQRNNLFSGREENLNRLHDAFAFSKSEASSHLQIIIGLEGIGKTQTAIEYVYRYSREYQAILWVRGDSHDTLVSDYISIAKLLNLPENNQQSKVLVMTAVKHWLTTNTGWLLIIDNIEDSEIISEFVPGITSGHILITTRLQLTERGGQHIELGEMEPAEGSLFLLRRAGIISLHTKLEGASVQDRAKAREISQTLEGLPLALDQAGAYIEETRCGLFSYLDLYQREYSVLLTRKRELDIDYPLSIFTAWSLTFEEIERVNPASAELLRLYAFLHPDAIPIEIITEGAPDLGTILQSVATEPIALDICLDNLLKFSLLHRNNESRVFKINHWLQNTIKDGMSRDMQRLWAVRAVRAVNRTLSNIESSAETSYLRYLPHALTCKVLIEQERLNFSEAKQLLDKLRYLSRENIQAEPQAESELRVQYDTHERQRCFVGCSHQAAWRNDFISACDAVLPELGLEAWYSDKYFNPTKTLLDSMLEMIANSRYCIFDLSYLQKNDRSTWQMPRNVLIELGMAIVLNRPILLLQHAENRAKGLKLPDSFENMNAYIVEFKGISTLKRALQEHLPQLLEASPERDWFNRYCTFGQRICEYREVHPHQREWEKENITCFISDGPDIDRSNFRYILDEVLKQFKDILPRYMDELTIPAGYNFLLCTYCQSVRSAFFAIYRITHQTTAETFISIGMSIALEAQFKYKIPKILLATDVHNVPSLLSGHRILVARNDKEIESNLQQILPAVILDVHKTVKRNIWDNGPQIESSRTRYYKLAKMKLFNTLSQSLEEFIPLDDKIVRMYVCGITPYDTTHLGHAFTYVSFDSLIRYLEFCGYTVSYVQNVNDIDDDVLRKAREVGMSWDELGRRETERYLRDMDALNVRRPDVYAHATQETPTMIEIIQTLMARGYAYEREGNVYYSVRHDREFGIMARAIGLNDYESLLTIANERGNFPDDPHKKDPLDFVLWQVQAPGEPSWPSPWGPGRPGWHIECSAMSMRYLGPQIDIHGGGADLAFLHHTCEIAQSEHFTGKVPFSRIWMHTGMVHQEGEKMSNSLGNVTLISDLLKIYSADAIRVTLLNHHYRYPWECFPEDLQVATETVELFKQVRGIVGEHSQGVDPFLLSRFQSAMQNDLNTPQALLLLRQSAETVIANQDKNIGAEILQLSRVLGLRV
jgi:cysteinyl-tRNA synthetase